MFDINYMHSVSEHPLISEHPLYQSLFGSPAGRYNFVVDTPSPHLNFIPTYYKNVNLPHMVVIEDFITLFFPHIHNGSNYKFDRAASFVQSYKNHFKGDNFKGILCHMRQTIDSIKTIFDDEEINNKLFYLDLSYNSPVKEPKKTDKVVITFTNSFGGTANNFPIRGGLEAVLAFKYLYELGYNIFMNLTGEIPVEQGLLSWLHKCPNVRLIQSDLIRHNRRMLSEEVIHNLLLDTDIFLIPSCRIHSMSVVRALCYGNVVVGSDGWGFNEFIDQEFRCAGQSKTANSDDGILRESYSLFLDSPNEELLSNLITRLESLIINPAYMDDIKYHNLKTYQSRFSVKKKNIEFEKIIDKVLA